MAGTGLSGICVNLRDLRMIRGGASEEVGCGRP